MLSWRTKLGSSMPCSSMLVTQSMWGSCFFSTARKACLHRLLVLDRLDIALAHVADGAGEKAAGAAGGVEEDFARVGVDAVDHEGRDGARRVVLAGVAGALQVVEDLLVDVAEVLALGEVVEVDLVDLVDDLPHELAGLHVVVGILEDVAHDAAAVALLARDGEFLELREKLVVDEGEQLVAGDAFGVGGPGAPPELLRDRRAVVRPASVRAADPGRR